MDTINLILDFFHPFLFLLIKKTSEPFYESDSYTIDCVTQGCGYGIMGRRKDNRTKYDQLTPEQLHAHVRKNISIPKYMDSFLYEHHISLSKLVQHAIIERMTEAQANTIRKDFEKQQKQKTQKKRLAEEQKKNPNFNYELQRAKQLLNDYFTAFDHHDSSQIEKKKQIMLTDFPELYVDILRFEQWEEENKDQYQQIRTQYENVVERLINIKQNIG